MSGSAPRAAVVIPHYNDVARLERCLTALAPQLDDTVEAVVVDNNSTADISGVRAAFAMLRFVVETEKGAAAARNRGVAETTAPTIFFLDCDCVPDADWISRAHGVAGRADLVGGRIDTFDETPPPRSGAEAFEAVFAFDQRSYIEEKNFSVTANLVTHRRIFDEIGGFRAHVSEDLEWCQRAVSAGKRLVYADELRVSHPTRSDWPALEKKWRRLTSEACATHFAAHGAGAKARASWAARAALVAVSALAHTPKVLASPALASTQERLRALGALFRLRFTRTLWMLGQSLAGR